MEGLEIYNATKLRIFRRLLFYVYAKHGGYEEFQKRLLALI
jgi:hypothetical protein